METKHWLLVVAASVCLQIIFGIIMGVLLTMLFLGIRLLIDALESAQPRSVAGAGAQGRRVR